jgi:hypothetical protein
MEILGLEVSFLPGDPDFRDRIDFDRETMSLAKAS